MDFKANQTIQKLRGGYYTPNDLAEFIAGWISNGEETLDALEPSCGDGNFLEAFSKTVSSENSIKITGIELDPDEAILASKRVSNFNNIQTKIINDDFLSWGLKTYNNKKFDAVVGNPPFIRYQFLPDKYQEESKKIFDLFNLKFTKHTNAWVPFVVLSFELLKSGGKLGMILPSEIMHVSHAQSLRTYLGKNASRLLILDPKELWFKDTLQGALILLAEKKQNKNDTSHGLGIKEVQKRSFVKSNPAKHFESVNFINGDTIKGKWTKAVLSKKELDLVKEIQSHKNVYSFSEIANVDVGIVTGANNFFLVNQSTVKKYSLEEYAYPMFGRSNHCPKIIYDNEQHKRNVESGLPSNFLYFDVANETEMHEKAREYIQLGEAQNLHERYKCRIRSPWFKVPSIYSTEIGMLKRSHKFPRLILNTQQAFTTDTAYRISVTKKAIKNCQLVFSFLNSFTALSAELEGRFYGGGVLELIPSEIEKLKIPIVDVNEEELCTLDREFRSLN
ncbi:MAG: N-6 DNA methylase [Candidatus Paceibacterota bacterium]